MKIKLKQNPCTTKQYEYIEILFNDVGFTRIQRNNWLTTEYRRSIKFISELTVTEATDVIQKLKEMKG